MKRRVLILVVGLLLIGVNGFAADGDLIVNGSVGIGTTTAARLFHVSGSGTVGRFESSLNINQTVLELFTPAIDVGSYSSLSFRCNNTSNTNTIFGTVSTLFDDKTAGAEKGSLVFRTANGGPAGEKMRITSSGNVGIGNTNPTHLLTMEAGDGGGYYSSGEYQQLHGWVDGSSGRWKSDVRPIANALDTVLKLNGVLFKWKKRTDTYIDNIDGTKTYVSSSWADNANGKNEIGLIGEDVLNVLPEVVDVDQKDSNFATGVAYSKIVAILIEAIKEQQKAIEDLQAQVNKMTGK